MALSKIRNVENVYVLCDLLYDNAVADAAKTSITRLIYNYLSLLMKSLNYY